ncbi:hypothetical protein V2K16_22835 [Pseudomonas alliivorans]|uniref:hypothetical protein n=1 Tax=Pseudomonas alliivorans TaxID=2810613 RepID=UPI001AE5A0C1|nr:hypothetical protein [Pseudomonas alliivorans]MBP0943117.1 hypothetical protein [Pseudomonas alliivorans]MEE4881213.1 hypothetical protein [Pseudomonas alliivorans]MEE4932517.1 hypothetical protein [Pseudomonas alliivorans]MEE4937980.1 hypothetical protein [Pseudomonas alliivorans]MEE4943087.1 hypothetical protein [Pseudomonas alliivorans]
MSLHSSTESVRPLDMAGVAVIIRYGLPLHEAIGRPRDFLVSSLPTALAVTLKGGRIIVKVRR